MENKQQGAAATFACACALGSAYFVYKKLSEEKTHWSQQGTRGWVPCDAHIEEALEAGFQTDELSPRVLTQDGTELAIDFHNWLCHVIDTDQKFSIRRCGSKPTLLKPRSSNSGSRQRSGGSRNETNFGDYETPYRDTPGKFGHDLDDVSSMTSVPPITAALGRSGFKDPPFRADRGELSQDLGPATKPYSICTYCRTGFVDTSFPCGHSYCTKCAVNLSSCIVCAPTARRQMDWLSELHSEWGENICRLCADLEVQVLFKRCGHEFCLQCISKVKVCPVCRYSTKQQPPILAPKDSEGVKKSSPGVSPQTSVSHVQKSSPGIPQQTTIEGEMFLEAGERSRFPRATTLHVVPSPKHRPFPRSNRPFPRSKSSFSPGDVTNLVASPPESSEDSDKVNKIEDASEKGILVFTDIHCGSSVAPNILDTKSISEM